jgi:hypothetical protein
MVEDDVHMDRKGRKLIKEIIVINIIVIVISIFLLIRYNNNIGILITIISLWTSFTIVRIIMNKYGVNKSNSIRDRLIRKLMKW